MSGPSNMPPWDLIALVSFIICKKRTVSENSSKSTRIWRFTHSSQTRPALPGLAPRVGRGEPSTDRPKLLWHWPWAVGRCSRLRGGQLFENKTQWKRVETRSVVSDVAISKRGRGEFIFYRTFSVACGPDSSSGKALGYGLDGPGSIPGVGGVEIFLRSFVSKLVLRSTHLL